MKPSIHPVLCIALFLILPAVFLVPFVSGAPTAAPTATVPPILQACSHAANPEAGFSCGFEGNESAIIPDGPPYIIRCFDNSSAVFNQSIVSWKWDFGDGGSSTDKNPRHTYADASRYDIRLTVTTFCGAQYSNSSVDSIAVYCSTPQPAFTTNVTEGNAPLAVAVTDTSLRTPAGTTRWTYWFDNNNTSSERNPVFTYTKPGTYVINQTVWKDCIPLGSSFYPPATRQIRVSSPLAGPVTATITQTGTGTTPAPLTPVVITASPEPVATTNPVPVMTAATGPGRLSVTTEPDGVKVFVDDAPWGTTPVIVPDIAAGPHMVRLEKDGYYSITLPVTITSGQTTEFSTSLMSTGSTGIALLPVIVLGLIVLIVFAGGAYLYLKQRAERED